MNRADTALACTLAALAGYVDALGYISTGGLFVAFMSGNSTVAGVAAARGLDHRVVVGIALVAAFVLGVVCAIWGGRRVPGWRMRFSLLLLAAGLGAAGLLHAVDQGTLAAVLLAWAMGTENTVFQRSGQPSTALTYMTGTLVRIGWRLAEVLDGGSLGPIGFDLLLWFGMMAGAGLGSALFLVIGIEAVWVAALVALLLAALRRN